MFVAGVSLALIALQNLTDMLRGLVPMILKEGGLLDTLALAYGVLGSLFMPFLAVTLLGLLNGKRATKARANTWKGNQILVITALLFIVLGVQQLLSALKPLMSR